MQVQTGEAATEAAEGNSSLPPIGDASRGVARTRHSTVIPFVVATLLALAAIWWGGATERPAQAMVFGGFGLLLLLAPARRWPAPWFLLGALLLCGIGATAWLPLDRANLPAWRLDLEKYGVTLPLQHSPQPQLSLDALILLAFGLAWIGWLSSASWNGSARRWVARLLAGGITVIAALSLLSWTFDWQIPGWRSWRGFGPIPGRNYTGCLLALGGILLLGCAADAGRRGWRKSLPWLMGLLIIAVALVANDARGGVLMFIGSIGVWTLIAARLWRSWRTLALGVAALLVVGSVVLVASGPLAARFAGGDDAQVASRTLIWRDTLTLIQTSPWLGSGLGNFASLFPLYRHDSLIQQRVLSPESDWLWLASELGWPAVVVALTLVFLLLRGAFPFTSGTQRHLRTVALAAVIAAALYGWLDVPGHGLACALPMLLVLGLARNGVSADAAPSLTASLAWRGVGLGFIAAALWWTTVREDGARAKQFFAANQFDQTETAATEALRRAPLDWQLYFVRGSAHARTGETLPALADFRRARLLEPHYAGLPLAEGRLWAGIEPVLALHAWAEALRRVKSPEDEALFTTMLDTAPDDPIFRIRLLALAENRPALQMAWLAAVPAAEAAPQLPILTSAAKQWDSHSRSLFQSLSLEIDRKSKRQALPAPIAQGPSEGQ